MPDHNENHYSEDLQSTADQLHRLRPEPSDELLQRVHHRARSSVASGRPSPLKPKALRSRAAVTAFLATGLLMTGGSAGLALSGVSDRGSAGSAQYVRDLVETGGTPQSPEETSGGEERNLEDVASGAEGDVQAVRQAEAGEQQQELPFTGLAAIPLLLLGIVLTATGLVLRRGLSGTPPA